MDGFVVASGFIAFSPSPLWGEGWGDGRVLAGTSPIALLFGNNSVAR